MSANNNTNENGVNNVINNSNNNKTTGNNQSVRPENVANDSSRLKSETNTSISRPLKFGSNDNNQSNDQMNENKFEGVYNACGESSGSVAPPTRPSRFPTLGQCSKDSQSEEKTVCCTNLAFNLYKKALESAKKALPYK